MSSMVHITWLPACLSQVFSTQPKFIEILFNAVYYSFFLYFFVLIHITGVWNHTMTLCTKDNAVFRCQMEKLLLINPHYSIKLYTLESSKLVDKVPIAAVNGHGSNMIEFPHTSVLPCIGIWIVVILIRWIERCCPVLQGHVYENPVDTAELHHVGTTSVHIQHVEFLSKAHSFIL